MFRFFCILRFLMAKKRCFVNKMESLVSSGVIDGLPQCRQGNYIKNFQPKKIGISRCSQNCSNFKPNSGLRRSQLFFISIQSNQTKIERQIQTKFDNHNQIDTKSNSIICACILMPFYDIHLKSLHHIMRIKPPFKWFSHNFLINAIM